MIEKVVADIEELESNLGLAGTQRGRARARLLCPQGAGVTHSLLPKGSSLLCSQLLSSFTRRRK